MITNEGSEHHHKKFMPIDTLAISKRLQASGVSRKQADTQAEIWNEIVNSNIATKHDLDNFQLAVKNDIDNFQLTIQNDMENFKIVVKNDMARIEEKIENSNLSIRESTLLSIEKIKTDMLRWVIPIVIGQVSVFVLLAKFLGIH